MHNAAQAAHIIVTYEHLLHRLGYQCPGLGHEGSFSDAINILGVSIFAQLYYATLWISSQQKLIFLTAKFKYDFLEFLPLMVIQLLFSSDQIYVQRVLLLV